MATTKKIDLGITALDELFMTDEQRMKAKLPRIYDIPITEIDDFPNHPFRITKDDDMEILKESIKASGIISHAVIRKKEDGRYEMISGHRRKLAAKEIGLETIPCSIVKMTKDEATILMVDSNLQRSYIGPCEKGRALKMKMEAIKHQGMRTDLASAPNGTKLNCPNGTKFNSSEVLAKENKSSHTNIYRYIALTNLLPDLQNAVDGKLMSMTAGLEIAKLDEDSQRVIFRCGNELGRYPKPSEALSIREAYENGTVINKTFVGDIFKGKHPDRIDLWIDASIFPEGLSHKERDAFVIKALEYYAKLLQKKKSREEAR